MAVRATAVLTVLLSLLSAAYGEPAAPPHAPRIGVLGALPKGFGGALTRAGIPFEYVTVPEHQDAKALARYDLLLVAAMNHGSEPWLPQSLAALDTYLLDGGRAVLEMGVRPAKALAAVGVMRVAGRHRQPFRFRLEPGDNPLAKLLPADCEWGYTSETEIIRPNDASVSVLARFQNSELQGQPAIVAGTAGRGRFVYWPSDLAYLQGNWTPDFEDLFLAVTNYLTDGRAKPRWAKPLPAGDGPAAAEPAAATVSAAALPDAVDLGPAPADGYCLRATLPKQGTGRLFVEWLPGKKSQGWVVEASRERATLRAAGAERGKSFALAGGEELVLVRHRGAVVLAQAGCEVGRLATPEVAGRHCYAQGFEEPLLQPTEPLYFTDDFASEASASGSSVWQPEGGTWSLTGQTPKISNTPGFALSGRDGLTVAGAWHWSDYRLEASVRAVDAKRLRLQIARWDAQNAVELALGVGDAAEVKLLDRRGDQTRELAQTKADVPAGQWLRLRVGLEAGRLVADLDGRRLLAVDRPTELLGAVALGAEGGSAIFDDVEVVDSLTQLGLPRLHPPSMDKGSDGLLDHDTWSSPAAVWVPSEEPGVLWHIGRFAGDIELRLPWRGAGAMTVMASAKRGEAAPVLTVSGPHRAIELVRHGGVWQATVDGRRAAVAGSPRGSVCLGLKMSEAGVAAEEVDLRAADAHEYQFERAPVDWWERSGSWRVDSRWLCQPQWSWLVGVNPQGPAVLWHKRRLTGDFVVDAPLSVRMTSGYGEPGSEPFERLCLSVCGDGRDPKSGYTFEIGSRGELCTLYRGAEPVATAKGLIPMWREIHNAWYDTRIERCGATLTVWFHGRQVISYTDPKPLGDGEVAIWTDHNGLVTPYVALYGQLAL